jgi:hypothetical protein
MCNIVCVPGGVNYGVASVLAIHCETFGALGEAREVFDALYQAIESPEFVGMG